MKEALTLLPAQVRTELLDRLRAPSTLVVALVTLVLSFLWLPDPSKNVTSISWSGSGGSHCSCVYNSAYLGLACAILAASFFSLIGFYLVNGTIRRDRKQGVGVILAASPLPNFAYLLGKAASGFCYLLVLSVFCLGTGVAVWLVYGIGSFSVLDFLRPWLFLVVPVLAITAAMAVLFESMPGLRGRGGFFAWFFVWSLLLVAVPAELPQPRPGGHPLVDPVGIEGTQTVLKENLASVDGKSFAIGIITSESPFRRVTLGEVQYSWTFIVMRALQFFWCIPILFLALFAFDRFDPARRRSLVKPPKLRGGCPADPPEVSGPAPTGITGNLTPVHARPSFSAAVWAEVFLLWTASPILRWILVAFSLLGGILPGVAAPFASAGFLLVLAPVLADVASREDLAGSTSLVFSQPSVPSSLLIWKISAAVLFVGASGLPLILRSFARSPLHGASLLIGLLFVASFAVSAGCLFRGSKLFAGLYMALWYMGLQGLEPCDFCAILCTEIRWETRVAYLLLSVAFLFVVFVVERIRMCPSGEKSLPPGLAAHGCSEDGRGVHVRG